MTVHKEHITVKGKKVQNISFDLKHRCMYIQFSDSNVSKTIEHSHSINIDFDKNGEVIGIEFVGVKMARGNFKQIFVELASEYNRPEFKEIPKEIKKELSFV